MPYIKVKMTGSMQEGIKALCGKLLECQDDDHARIICLDLKKLIHEHIEELRVKVRITMGK